MGAGFRAIDWLTQRQHAVDDLMEASRGNYTVIRDLVKVLEHGPQSKDVVDDAIDSCMSTTALIV